jgi:HPt (histidine-containing phosphotransfer) domain-containing protein
MIETNLPAASSPSIGAPAGAKPPLNDARLREMQVILDDCFGEFVDAYLVSMDDILSHADTASAPGQEKELERLMHSLKSASMNAGADDLALLCAHLETLLHRQQPAPAGDLERIRGEALRVREALTPFL